MTVLARSCSGSHHAPATGSRVDVAAAARGLHRCPRHALFPATSRNPPSLVPTPAPSVLLTAKKAALRLNRQAGGHHPYALPNGWREHRERP